MVWQKSGGKLHRHWSEHWHQPDHRCRHAHWKKLEHRHWLFFQAAVYGAGYGTITDGQRKLSAKARDATPTQHVVHFATQADVCGFMGNRSAVRRLYQPKHSQRGTESISNASNDIERLNAIRRQQEGVRNEKFTGRSYKPSRANHDSITIETRQKKRLGTQKIPLNV